MPRKLWKMAPSYQGKRLRMERLEDRRMLAQATVYQHTDNGTGSIGGSLSRAILDINAAAVFAPNDVHEIRFQFNDVNHNDPYITITGTLPKSRRQEFALMGSIYS